MEKIRKILKALYLFLFGSNKDKYNLLYFMYSSCSGRYLKCLMHYWIEKRYNIIISKKAKIGKKFRLVHPIGVVIGAHVVIGDNVRIYQNVTIGGARLGDAGNEMMPKIGDDTIIFAGAVVLGGVEIGRNCIIGANSVVNCNVPDNSVAVGVPVRILDK